MQTIMTEDDFINWLVSKEVTTRLGDVVIAPECFYKKFSGEINAEKIMMVVLKARSQRKIKSRQSPIVTPPPAIPAGPKPSDVPVSK